MSASRQPAVFLSHGGGPCFWMDFPPPFGRGAFNGLKHYLAGLLQRLPERPRAVLLISAHWEESTATVGSGAQPGMLFDYYGFPDHTYQLHYPAPGAPALAATIAQRLRNAGIACSEDPTRDFDHGVFVPMLIVDPAAQLPVVMLSLQRSLDPSLHLAMGAALAPLRDEGVLILGSGNSYHNLAQFMDGRSEDSAAFDGWLSQAVTQPGAAQRAHALMHWREAPRARAAHPREEHLLPLMVVAGAGGDDTATRDYHEVLGGKHISGYAFGMPPAPNT